MAGGAAVGNELGGRGGAIVGSALGLPANSVRISKGKTSSRKIIEITGLDAGEVHKVLARHDTGF